MNATARQADVREVSSALERPAVAQQELAAPHRAVGAVPRAVEDDTDDPLRQPVLDYATGQVRVVMLNGQEVQPLGRGPFGGVAGRGVVGMQVVDDGAGRIEKSCSYKPTSRSKAR